MNPAFVEKVNEKRKARSSWTARVTSPLQTLLDGHARLARNPSRFHSGHRVRCAVRLHDLLAQTLRRC
jgi:hypothetical protein